ncbi:zinc metalloprotease HtpX [Methanosarcina mazei]|jgi:heat shock protein HtpX|uniref:Protease HtpX homolog 2 n=6 Tax=Methanosarcina mazei TaxID=2209 RepID=HTPX2_METMA|nr:zinc metalloprotease HtpX [Methanosarcina mazei]Q8PSE5.1 RecName: Full=Protease HtpX homolog 2 [Methanosarcina mazei Go1]AAM32830.1 protease HTPX [Methanosarcina mazei Go1]AKB40495.1 heat shock protein [Methanosarcina mazei WWM610]AKB61447.1 heat shock protein [Methanosarcina mazei SarPi]AKB64745.1 heat shock protein [Methanosarcina mazei S-6]AKB68163.1 heat shock protein [Methanosarcina mazei LYC]
MKRKWERDLGLQGRMLFTMFLLAAVYLFFLAFLSYYGTSQIFIILFIGLFMAAQYFYSDKMVLWTTGAQIVSESEAPQLHGMITRLCAIADLPKPQVAIVRTQVPNAFATGRNQNKAVVAVTTGLMDKLSPAELEAVLAHELSHVKNRDMAVLTIASFLSSVAFYIVRYSLYFGNMGGGRRKEGGGIMLVWLVSIVVWIVSFLLIRALSRYREFSADRGAAVITGQPANLASALMKISGVMDRVPGDDLRKVEGMNAFFIIPAISGSSIMDIFSTHPSVEKRIAKLEKMQQEMS